MGKKKSGPGRSFSPSPKRRPKEEVTHIHQPALAAPEALWGKRQDKGSNESAEQDPAAASGPPERSPSKPFLIVGVGASAGGLEAFTSFLKALPADTGMAFVLVQHMDPAHESLLNRLLAKDTAMPVIQVKDGMSVERNCVYVIPPNTKMTIHAGRLRLVVRPGGATRHTPIDSFLSALAEDQQGMAIGVILSGIGSDGTKGLQSIKAEGGITFVQDEDSAKFPGMPLSAVAAGCVDLVLSPDRIARELARMRRHPYLEFARSPVRAELPSGEGDSLHRLFQLMRSFTGVDFTHYKQTTILRRISRRMLVQRCETLAQYVKCVEDHPDEVRALFQDILVHVTSFFREPAVFQTLQGQVFPRITASLTSGESVRIWVPGCSTGEEVYSLAIAFHEYFGEAAMQTEIKIFGSDLSDLNVQKARAAVYSEASTDGLSPERLRRFFVKIVARLPGGQAHSGNVRFRPPRSDQRPSLRADGHNQLPECADLPDAGFAEKSPGFYPLRSEAHRLFDPGQIRKPQRGGEFVFAGVPARPIFILKYTRPRGHCRSFRRPDTKSLPELCHCPPRRPRLLTCGKRPKASSSKVRAGRLGCGRGFSHPKLSRRH